MVDPPYVPFVSAAKPGILPWLQAHSRDSTWLQVITVQGESTYDVPKFRGFPSLFVGLGSHVREGPKSHRSPFQVRHGQSNSFGFGQKATPLCGEVEETFEACTLPSLPSPEPLPLGWKKGFAWICHAFDIPVKVSWPRGTGHEGNDHWNLKGRVQVIGWVRSPDTANRHEKQWGT